MRWLRTFQSFVLASTILNIAPQCASARKASGESHTGNLLLGCSAPDACAGGVPAVDELTCKCFVCSVPCESDQACWAKLGKLEPFSAPEGATYEQKLRCRIQIQCGVDLEEGPATGSSGTCEVECESDAECSPFGSGFACIGHFCRGPDPTLPAANTPLTCPEGMVGVHGEPKNELDAFCLDATEVTVLAYQACLDEKVCATPPSGNLFAQDHERHPVNFVSPQDAETYCNRLNRQLPTLAQWRWAARNGVAQTRYPWGDEPPRSTDDRPRVCALGATDNDTCAVGSFASGRTTNQVSDLAGNVDEIVVTGEQTFGVAGGSYLATDATVTGGGAALSGDDIAEFDAPDRDTGFRCAARVR